ncbi:MAG: hypothetical protein R2749_26365 [Acidimicrobiales bacterium]
MANSRPDSTEDTASTGQDQAVGGTSRPKTGLGIRSVGRAMTTADTSAASTALRQRRAGHVRNDAQALDIPPTVPGGAGSARP